MSYADLIECAIKNWYQKFEKYTFKSIFIPADKNLLEYLDEESIYIPEGRKDDDKFSKLKTFLDDVNSAIDVLGGEVIPKFTWSVPRDAVWVSPGHTTKCQHASEVLLLLKSSNQVTHDLDHAFDDCTPSTSSSEEHQAFKEHWVCLRRWHEVDESREFRCFVRSKSLIAVSQRHVNYFFPGLQARTEEFKTLIKTFFDSKIKEHFMCDDYVFDVYIDDGITVKLVDFNPFNPSTNPLLFTYNELHSFTTTTTPSIPLRLVEEASQVRDNPFEWDAFPEDLLHVTKGLDSNKFADILKMDIQSRNDDEEDDGGYDDDDEKYED